MGETSGNIYVSPKSLDLVVTTCLKYFCFEAFDHQLINSVVGCPDILLHFMVLVPYTYVSVACTRLIGSFYNLQPQSNDHCAPRTPIGEHEHFDSWAKARDPRHAYSCSENYLQIAVDIPQSTSGNNVTRALAIV